MCAFLLKKPDFQQQLEILSEDSKYDLACSCGTSDDEHRKQGRDGKWIYPVALPDGRKGSLFKILLSNHCANDCKYCPLRSQRDINRCTLDVDKLAQVFMEYYRSGKVFGLFLSSGLIGTPDYTMDRILAVAKALRIRHNFKGYMHLKIIPGSSDAAVFETINTATAVSINIEVPGRDNLLKLSAKKDYEKDIIRILKLVSGHNQSQPEKSIKQTTQFIVGAAGESDKEILHYSYALYERLKLNRIYFSAYQKGLGSPDLPGEKADIVNPLDTFKREHRLYQMDFLIRKYGFDEGDFSFDSSGNFDIDKDPKQVWADRHPQFFPININKADKQQLLRVPGIGNILANRILKTRRQTQIRNLSQITRLTKTTIKAQNYITY